MVWLRKKSIKEGVSSQIANIYLRELRTLYCSLEAIMQFLYLIKEGTMP
jgi:hypothetical protein